jgi:hypothetical protein
MGNVQAREQEPFAESASDRAAREGGVQVQVFFIALAVIAYNTHHVPEVLCRMVNKVVNGTGSRRTPQF